MGFSCGIVGLPNAGKSTFFNGLMTRAASESANYPFCTIEPHRGQVAVPDERLTSLATLSASQSVIPATIEVVDIAGLVRGASEGEGLGNRFLAHIREVDAIAHVVRCYESEQIVHVESSVDAVRDVGIINTELILADLATVESMTGRLRKNQDKESHAVRALLARYAAWLNEGKRAHLMPLKEAEQLLTKHIPLLTLKPLLYVANVSDGGGGDHAAALSAYASEEGALCVSVACGAEAEIVALEEDQRDDYRSMLGLQTSALQLFLQKGYELLGLQSFFTSGPQETRAWSYPTGTAAPQAAGLIHGDFERGFIAAEVAHYEDIMACNGWENAKAQGKIRVQGKDYLMQDGDVVFFRFNVQ